MVKLVLKINLKDFSIRDDNIDQNAKNTLLEILKNDSNYFDSITFSFETNHSSCNEEL
jgi:hypothetical protein